MHLNFGSKLTVSAYVRHQILHNPIFIFTQELIGTRRLSRIPQRLPATLASSFQRSFRVFDPGFCGCFRDQQHLTEGRVLVASVRFFAMH